MAFVSQEKSLELMRRLVAAFGLEGKPVQKLVIEVGVDQMTQVYVKMLGKRDQIEQVCEAFEVVAVGDVSVADDCTVVLIPAE